MALAHSCPDPGRKAARQPGPNQWFKDHLDSVIEAELLQGDARAASAGERVAR
ncbi:hypothetical protein ACMA1D_14805 [Streptomyces sp. 796.1]|uniref:hypothetical protein n=1 Tax=Streptomyces sp. 796.1 TaxID=3163029 RepID=UPI0039C994E8